MIWANIILDEVKSFKVIFVLPDYHLNFIIIWLKDMILFEYLNLKCVSFIAMNRTPWCDDEMGTDELTVGNDI